MYSSATFGCPGSGERGSAGGTRLYIETLTIRNFRCFTDATLELNYPGRSPGKDDATPLRNPNVNLFLGGNGSGKSSVFKALALGVIAPIISNSGFQAEHLVRRQPGEIDGTVSFGGSSEKTGGNRLREETASVGTALRLSQIDAEFQPNTGDSVTGGAVIRRFGDVEKVESEPFSNPNIWDYMFYNESPAFFLAGYGANRRTERPEGYSEQSRSPRYQRVASLFEDHVGLVPFSYASLQLKSLGAFAEARSLLNALIPPAVQLTELEDKQKRPLFENDGVLLPFPALSDGFRTFAGWVWDLLYQIAKVQYSETANQTAEPPPRPGLAEMSGVVVVDEIDLFLHPEWQRIVVDLVVTAFPNLQFLFSTHSPLVAGALEPANIFVMETGSGGTVDIARYSERIHGLSANQILTSSYFGLRSTRAPEAGTLTDLARSLSGSNELVQGASFLSVADSEQEQAEPNDRMLSDRARRMLEEIGAA